ncbi:MAG: HIT domain-containing protein [Candidatus Gracilibacteria bacterium]
MDCLFCKIVSGDIPAPRIYEDENIIIIEDLHPKAPVHALVIPKKHIESIALLREEDAGLVGDMHIAAAKTAKDHYKIPGYKVMFNVNKEGGQEIMHLHLHLLGGAELSMPNAGQ